MKPDDSPPNAKIFSIRRSMKLGSFHIGSSLGDLLTSAVWNRVMITDLGVVAWPVALLSALRYLLSPLTLWAGHRSDTHPIFGSRRVAYIWLGRFLMLLSLPLLPLSTEAIAQDRGSWLGWGLALCSFLFYGGGTLVSGAPFLALVHDSAPYERRGQAVSIVQLFLVVSFAFIPALYARVMPDYDPAQFSRLVMMGVVGAAIFWFFAVWGEEHSRAAPPHSGGPPSFGTTFGALWGQTHTRRYALFLAASAFFAFMQDAILEPFGGDVFGLSAGETTRFNAFWGSGVLVGMLGTILVTRHRRPDQQVHTTARGLMVLAGALACLSGASLLAVERLVTPTLIMFGLGFGVFTVGGVSLLMAMTTETQAGSYLALWSVIQLVARGAGIAGGGLIRDLAIVLTGQFSTAYAVLFAIEAAGVVISIGLLYRVNISDDSLRTPPEAGEILAAAGE